MINDWHLVWNFHQTWMPNYNKTYTYSCVSGVDFFLTGPFRWCHFVLCFSGQKDKKINEYNVINGMEVTQYNGNPLTKRSYTRFNMDIRSLPRENVLSFYGFSIDDWEVWCALIDVVWITWCPLTGVVTVRNCSTSLATHSDLSYAF